MAVRATRNQLWLLGLARDGKLYQDGIDSLAVDLWSGIRRRGDLIVTIPVVRLRDRGLLELGELDDSGRRLWRPTADGFDVLTRDDRRRERVTRLTDHSSTTETRPVPQPPEVGTDRVRFR